MIETCVKSFRIRFWGTIDCRYYKFLESDLR